MVLALGLGPTLIVIGPGAFLGTANLVGTDAEVDSAADLDPSMLVAVMAGNPVFALLAIMMIALAYGRAGLGDLRSRLLRWRVGVRWYAVALLTAPVLWIAIQGALSLTSDAFIPGIITADQKASLLVTGLVVGLVAAVFEEIAWTGFATHELRKRHGPWATGLTVGLLWCVLHLSLFAGADSGAVPRVLSVAAVFSWMLAYRLLMVWVYGHTQSVLLAIVMHLPISVMGFVLASPTMAGIADLIFNLAFGATLWALVAAVAKTERRRLSRPNLHQVTATGT
ncbi:CPBP family intramembrane glutamic endopeptidase [Actinomycetospora cinnamomea]|uniref:CPBP family intramembrane glutamic endopeptidase n=1 Tax=Actinomycetospora cinnamomea TaxID=663609 RepID=UPI00140207EE|nr:CPBP family intramembrane glutamic endopeptidase [Actinomycetospora cinnamomea]